MSQTVMRIRTIILGGVLLLGMVFVRLIDVQLLRGEQFSHQANENRLFTLSTPQLRGVFLDRFGLPLVHNMPKSYKRLDSKALYSVEESIHNSEMVRLLATDSASVSQRLYRHYVYPESLAHAVGYATVVSQEDLEKDNALYRSDVKGRSGLEFVYDGALQGEMGSEIYEIDALGRKQKLIKEISATSGKIIQTSLDPVLSEIALQALGEKTGAILIMDAETGALLSLVSTPSFNANFLSTEFVDETLESDRKRVVQDYINDGRNRFFNRAISGVYPPGSVFKIVSALAGLDSGKIDYQTTVVDEGILTVGEYSYANWYYSQYGGVEGVINLQRALARSNDIFFYKTAEWAGPETIAEMARLFGFGKKTEVDLSSEAQGLVPDPTWKEHTIGEKWFLGNTYHFGIGQGDLLVTPLQVASMTQAIGNGGEQCVPHVIAGDPQCSSLGIREEYQELVLAGMIDACSVGGTAFPFFENNQLVVQEGAVSVDAQLAQGIVACKTGTAEFGVTNEQGIKKTHAWFIAVFDTLLQDQVENVKDLNEEVIATKEQATENIARDRLSWLQQVKKHSYPKRLAVAVLVESDAEQPHREGSRDAAPVAKDIFDWVRGSEK